MDSACVSLEAIDFPAGDTALFENFNLRIPEGGCTVLMGPAGCGKSMVLKIAAGILVPTAGRVVFRGESWDLLNDHETTELRSKMGFVFQNGALWANKTIYQNIELPLVFHKPKTSKSEILKIISDLCDKLGYDGDLSQRPSQLSLGEQKLISFIRALAIDPEVLFLDDPTASLDGQSKDRVLSVLEDFTRRGHTTILVTQDPNVTARLANTLIILKAGKVLTSGPFDQVTRSNDPEVIQILTSVLSQAATFSSDILDLLSGGNN